jgi:pterin-4a-carbinolamine dehydratase
MLFGFSDSEWHFGLDGVIEMANAYPHTPLLLYHWGSVDAPISNRSTPTLSDHDAIPRSGMATAVRLIAGTSQSGRNGRVRPSV